MTMFGWLILAIIILILLILFYRKVVREAIAPTKLDRYTVDNLSSLVQERITSIIKQDDIDGATEAELNAAIQRYGIITNANKQSLYGIDTHKETIIAVYVDIISQVLKTRDDCINVINFESVYIDPYIMFEALLYKYSKVHGKDAFTAMVREYNLADVRYIIEDGERPSYIITQDDIIKIYKDKIFSGEPNEDGDIEQAKLNQLDMKRIIAKLIFNKRGFGCIDTIRSMNINGVVVGTKGSLLPEVSGEKVHISTKSVTINFGGKYIHLSFLDFRTEAEMRRIINLLPRYQSPGSLTEKRGYIVTTMYDKSRLVVAMPPAAESYVAFIRKFSSDPWTLRALLYKDDPAQFINNWQLPLNFINWFMTAGITTGFTGRQGSGKTTMMNATVASIDPRYNIRVIEMAPELYLREAYPQRDIMSFAETPFIGTDQLRDLQKKSDGAVAIFGEVATDKVAADMLQAAQVGSIFTIFSHHANTANDLVIALRDSIVSAKSANPLSVARDIVHSIHLNVHLDFDTEGKRFIRRISEIVPYPDNVPYPDLDLTTSETRTNTSAVIQAELAKRLTDRPMFVTHDLMVYDSGTNSYRANSRPSSALLKKMLQTLTPTQQKQFKADMVKNGFMDETLKNKELIDIGAYNK